MKTSPVALVTGSSTGIGRGTALHLARQGYGVYASVINPTDEDAQTLAETSRQEGLNLVISHLDVTKAEMCSQIVEQILAEDGQIDVLINNAGISDGGPLEFVSDERLRRVFEVNFFGPMRLMRLIVPGMRKSQSGTIVNITSVMGQFVRTGGSAYSASKFALEAASEALALEVSRFNIRVAMIEPGVVKTPLHKNDGPGPDLSSPYAELDIRDARLFSTLLKNPLYPKDVAQLIQHAIETDQPKLRYLVGEDAQKWIHGRQLMTDEDWVDVGKEMSLDEFVKYYREKYDMEI